MRDKSDLGKSGYLQEILEAAFHRDRRQLYCYIFVPYCKIKILSFEKNYTV